MVESTEHDYDWLIIFLVYNNNYYDLENQDTEEYYTMEEQTKYILNQIRHTRHNKRVKIIFVEAEIKNRLDRTVATISFLYKKEGTWLSAVNGVWRDGETIDVLTNEKSLKGILETLKYKFSAKKHMIITAGHGSIIGINYFIPELKQSANRQANKAVEPIFQKPSVFLSAITFQKEFFTEIELEDKRHLLFLANQEISEALNSVFSDKKVDVLVMYNCLMQNIFTQFDFRKTVDWLVAPLSGISIPGFNYGDIINEISNNPSITGETVSGLFTSSIRTGNHYCTYKTDIEDTWKIAAVKMNEANLVSIQEKFDTLFEKINDISQKAISTKQSDDVINCINETARHLFNYGAHCLPGVDILDIGILLEYLKVKITTEYANLSDLIQYIEDLQSTLALQTEKHIFEGDNFYNNQIPHKEDDPSFKKAVVNMGLLFPFRIYNSELLDFIYERNKDDKKEDLAEPPKPNKFIMPSFLKNKHYAAVINKILQLPQ